MRLEETDASDVLAWGDVETWNSDQLEATGQTIQQRVYAIVNEQDEARRGDTSGFWVGDAGDAQRRAQKGLMKRLETEVTDLSLAYQAIFQAADQVELLQESIVSVHSYIQQYKFAVSHDGMVSDPHPPPLEPGATAHDAQLQQDTRSAAVQECADMISDVLVRAADIDGQLWLALQDSMIDEYGDGNASTLANAQGYGVSRIPDSATMVTRPPEGGSAGDVAAWWQMMTPDQRQEIITKHPDWIHNLDGVPYKVRDQINRTLLKQQIKQCEDERRALSSKIAQRLEVINDSELQQADYYNLADSGNTSNDPELARDSKRLERLNIQIADLEGVKQGLAAGGDSPTQLVTLDLSRPRVEAVISVGDLDAANNVAVFTPGFSSTTQGLGHNVSDLAAMQARIAADTPSKPATASVVWLGYQAPQLDGIATSSNSVASTQEAQHGAPRLASFFQGIRASHMQPVDITAIGHSYGSLVTGLALKEGGNPDKVVFLGSPGVGVEHSAELHVPSRNIYAEDAIYDPVPDLQPYDGFGADPRDLESAHVLDSESATVKETKWCPPLVDGHPETQPLF